MFADGEKERGPDGERAEEQARQQIRLFPARYGQILSWEMSYRMMRTEGKPLVCVKGEPSFGIKLLKALNSVS